MIIKQNFVQSVLFNLWFQASLFLWLVLVLALAVHVKQDLVSNDGDSNERCIFNPCTFRDFEPSEEFDGVFHLRIKGILQPDDRDHELIFDLFIVLGNHYARLLKLVHL